LTASAARSAGRLHHLSDERRHFKFDNSLEPALTVESGDTVVMTCREAADSQFTIESDLDTVKTMDWGRIHALTGPVAMAGAEPGDVLKVEILDFEHEGWGWTCIYPGFGLLPEDFGDLIDLHIWKAGPDGRAELKPGIRVPIEPFMGMMGVAPKEPGEHATMPPRHVGGNLDIRHLCKGSTAYFPVEVAGALFSVGDGHLAQGDGEVCGLAIEAPLVVTLRFSLVKGRSIPSVQCDTPGGTTDRAAGMGYFVTTATGQDLNEGVKVAVRSMIDHLEAEYGLTRPEAYMLCSVAGDLKIAVPKLGEAHASNVTFHMPYSVFVG
jgi:acetamidase/formamidase